MTPTFRERLMFTLTQNYLCYNCRPEHPCDKCEKAHAEILKAVREIVPKESTSTCVCDRDACWNDCRQAILDKIGDNDGPQA